MLVGKRAWGLLRPLSRLPPSFLPPHPSLLTVLRSPFSEFFDRQDKQELDEAVITQNRKQFLHYKLTDHWKKNLERKQHRRERKVEIAQNKIPPQPTLEKLVVHNPAVGIEYPPRQDEVFAVVQIDGFQYKILEDTVLFLDTKKDHAINQPFILKSVPLIGTRSYTLIGRPNISSAYVEAIVESISASKKVIVFKKKRRKNYKRSFGMRTSLTQCRIIRIVHELTEEVQAKAIALQ